LRGKILDEVVLVELYEALQAGYEIKFRGSIKGLEISIIGFDDKI